MQGKARTPTGMGKAPTRAAGTAEPSADTNLAHWSAVDAALAPVIGTRGVRALLQRSLFLCQPAHPCLMSSASAEASPPADEFAALRNTLAACEPDVAAAADAALWQTYASLLNQLIGTALTERLIGHADAPPTRGAGPEDSAP